MSLQTHYKTSDVAQKDRFAYWHEAVCETYVELGCEALEKANFKGEIDISRHSVLSVSKVGGSAHLVRRRKRDIQRATDGFFLLSIQTGKSSSVSQFGKTCTLLPGDMALYASTDPYMLELSEGFSQLVVQLPKEKLLQKLPNAELMTAKKLDNQLAVSRLIKDNIITFANQIETADITTQTLMQETIIDLIATGLAMQNGHVVELSSPEQHVMLRVKSYIRNHLADPSLDRQQVANEIGMSVRRLNAIFAKDGTSLSAFIRQSRIKAVAQDLTDPRFAHQTISEIAFRHGFNNLQSFSANFRTFFEMAPREYRAAHATSSQIIQN